jgi:uncharacterized protein (DUF2147 family)
MRLTRSPIAEEIAMRTLITNALTALIACTCLCAVADTATPAGVWRTIDDKTRKERSLIRIVENNGVYTGKVEKILNPQPDDDPNNLCRKCEGERKDKPVIGMTILWGLKKDGDHWSGGEILDPKNGKIYRARMKLVDGGRKLEVRGFIGISLLGRSQTWQREE